MADLPPPAPSGVPENQLRRRRSRYDRPRSYVSIFGIVVGVVLGIAAGLYYAWIYAPVEEFGTSPHQLSQEDRDHYLVAIMLDYERSGDLKKTIERLIELKFPGDPRQAVADVACRLASTGYVNSTGGLRAIRSMMLFYQAQGKSGCADELISVNTGQLVAEPTVIVLPTPTLLPPATKTPTPVGSIEPSPTSPPPVIPTNVPSRQFDVVAINTFCDTELSGIIEVRVQDFSGEELPGQPIRVRWNGGESKFFTGLKPERGVGYADFDMEDGLSYIIEMPGLSDPVTNPLVAQECFTPAGQQAITSYRVVFRSG